jgi:hypothetical protein
MELFTLGRSGLKVSPLCLGGNVFGWTIDEKRSFELLNAFVGAGFNFIDTADVYSTWVPGHQGGESEALIGSLSQMWRGVGLFRLDARGLDDRPPFLDLRQLQRGKRLRILLLAGNNFLADFRKALTHACVGQGVNQRRIQFSDDILGRTLWGPKPMPIRNIESRQSRLVHRRNIRRCWQSTRRRDRINFDAARPHLRDARIRHLDGPVWRTDRKEQ